MTSELWREAERLFHEACELDPSERAAFLDRTCGDDRDLRAEIDALLAADDETSEKESSFMRPPSSDTVFDALADTATPETGTMIGAYRVLARIALGGMGVVLRAERADGTFEQTVAIKLIARGTDRVEVLRRFETERRTLARLEHPNIARLYDGGATDTGLPYLVMEYVDGVPIDVYCKEHDLSLVERLELVRAVCAAVDHAHHNLVIHRDLKPSNILVDTEGTAKLLDFGIAKVLDDDKEDDPTLTRHRAMTPAYASPEQIEGGPVTTATDVWSLGVVLYELLAGRRPFGALERPIHEVARAICEDDPSLPSTIVGAARLARYAGQADRPLQRVLSGDLDAIVLQALRKEPERRYASARDLGDDLGRYLDGLPVLARPDTIRYRVIKFVRRNRLAVGAAIVFVLTLVAGIVGTTWQAHEAKEQAAHAWRSEQSVLRLSDIRELDDLEAGAEELWPAYPDRIDDYRTWIGRAETLAARFPTHEATLSAWRAAAQPDGEDGWTFASTSDRWRHGVLTELVERLRAFADPEGGGIADVAARLEFASTLGVITLEEAAAEWEAAVEAVAMSDLYDGLEIVPQVGLIPIGPDPESGLWEFAHVQTGRVPARDVDGRLVVDEETGVVLVLLPGGTFRMGAERPAGGSPAGDANRDAVAASFEGPIHEVTLDPFFLSKYELTQAQWERFTAHNPSVYSQAERDYPVDSVSWNDADRVLRQLGLTLPTEAQWEYAARAGTGTPWWTGADPRSLQDAVNLADDSARLLGAQNPAIEEWLTDGYRATAPVGSYRPNPMGLHGMLGNLSEWCADPSGVYTMGVEPGTGLRVVDAAESDVEGVIPSTSSTRMMRGGNYSTSALGARSSHRYVMTPDLVAPNVGVRPARPLSR